MKVRGTDFILYQVADTARSIEFYRDVLGMELESYFEEFSWAEFKAEPTTLALCNPAAFQPGAEPKPGGASICLAVDNVVDAVEELRGQGVPIIMEPFESPVCWNAAVADPDGNGVGLHQRKDGTFG